MYCSNCGKEINDSAFACIHCGFAAKSENNYCTNCGESVNPKQVICTNCGTRLQKNKTFDLQKPAIKKVTASINLLISQLKKYTIHGINLLLWLFGIIFLVMGVQTIFKHPGILYAYLEALSLIMISSLMIPPIARRLNTTLNNKLNWLVRTGLIILLIIISPQFMKYKMEDFLEGMTPEQRTQYDKEQELQDARNYEEWLRDQVAERNEELRNNKHAQEIQDANEDNERQRQFYSELGSSKILYKCKDNPFIHAFGGAKGSYNSLLKKALNDCGEGNLEVLKKSE